MASKLSNEFQQFVRNKTGVGLTPKEQETLYNRLKEDFITLFQQDLINPLKQQLAPQKGLDGERGKDGTNGTNGRDGAPGPIGPMGPPGKDGINGKDGVTKTITEVVEKVANTEDLVNKKEWEKTLNKLQGAIQSGGGAREFNQMIDTPKSYSGQAGKTVSVRSDERGLEFVDASAEMPFQAVEIVTTPQQLSGTLDSDKVYLIDGIVDFTGTGLNIEVPAGGLSIRGWSFDISGLVCSDAGYTLFTSPPSGSGNLVIEEIGLTTSGIASQIYDIRDSDGTHGLEIVRVNYNNCTSLGTIDGYRQGLEDGTGRFGGTPELILAGAWAGGFRISTSITRGISNSMSGNLFTADLGFTMGSRFLTDMNVDLGTNAGFTNFSSTNFPNPSTFQIQGAIITRNGVVDPTDTTINPNINSSNLSNAWRDNVGIENTFEGGRTTVTSEAVTTINTVGVFVDVAGTFTADSLVHYDSPAQGQLRHIGDSPRDYLVELDLIIEGNQDTSVTVQLVKNNGTTDTVVGSQTRFISRFGGPNDRAFFHLTTPIALDRNDTVRLQVANNTGIANLTVEDSSYILITQR